MRTARSSSWFTGSAIITNVYLSTLNRWTGAWPTAASYLAVSGKELVHTVDNDDDDDEEEDVLKTDEARCNSSDNTADTRQVRAASSTY